jgi:hypothetical protein
MNRWGVAAALVVGVGLGVLSADGWRLDIDAVTVVSGVQSTWVLLPWVAALLLARSPREGVPLGAACGLVAISSYYLYEAVAYTLHSATSQLTSAGAFWIPASTAVGGLFGWFGVVAARSGRPAPYAWAAMVVPFVGEAIYVWHVDRSFVPGIARLTVTFLLAVAVLLTLLGLRRFPARRFALALPVALAVGLVAFAGAIWLEHTFAYVTL